MTGLARDPKERLKEWLATGAARLVPLSFPQRELWENSPVPPGDPAHHICATIDIRGAFPSQLCDAALQSVVARHEVLRTTFLAGAGKVVQVVRASTEPTLQLRELTSGLEALPAGLHEVFTVPFDLVRGPLHRVEMLRLAEDHHVLALVFHHAIADGWSLGVFVEDFCTAYVLALRGTGHALRTPKGVKQDLQPLPLTYSMWAAEQRARWHPDEVATHANRWRTRLSGAHPFFGSTALPSPPPSLHRLESQIPEAIADSARSLARRTGSTLFTTLLAAFHAALFAWRGTQDLVVGTPHANRSRSNAKEAMGYFAGVVPLRTSLAPEDSFLAFLKRSHALIVEDFAHAMPFAELAAALKESAPPTRHPIFDVRFALQNHPIPDISLPGISTRLRTRSTGTSRFDIACELTEDGLALEVVWIYQPCLLSHEEVLTLDGVFQRVLEIVAASPEIRLAAIKP